MENYLGRLLTDKEVVHHKDHDKTNNTIENLQVMTAKEHRALHAKENPASVVKAICPACAKEFTGSKSNLGYKLKLGKTPCCSIKCSNSMLSKKKVKGITKTETVILKIKELRTLGGSSYSIANDLCISRNTVMKYWN